MNLKWLMNDSNITTIKAETPRNAPKRPETPYFRHFNSTKE